MTEIEGLREQVAKAAGPDPDLDREIWYAVVDGVQRPPEGMRHPFCDAFTASIDAALALARRRIGENAQLRLVVDPIVGLTEAKLAGSWTAIVKGTDVPAAARAIVLATLEAALSQEEPGRR